MEVWTSVLVSLTDQITFLSIYAAKVIFQSTFVHHDCRFSIVLYASPLLYGWDLKYTFNTPVWTLLLIHLISDSA